MMAQSQHQHPSQSQTQASLPYFISPHPFLPQHQAGFPPQSKPISAVNDEHTRFKLEGKEPTLELLQSRFSRPLVDVAKEFHVSLTMMKRLCRKLGIRRWPHRQIRSIDKLLSDLEERAQSTTSSREQEYLREQISLYTKKRRLVTRGASSGLPGALRNVLFMADPSVLLDEEDLFKQSKLSELEKALETLPPSEQRKVMHKGETNPVLKIMTQANAKPALKRKRLKASSKAENAVRAIKDEKSVTTSTSSSLIGRLGENNDGRHPSTLNVNMGWGNSEHSMSHLPQYSMMGMWPWTYGDMTNNLSGNNPNIPIEGRPDMTYMYNPYHADPIAAAAMFHHQQQMHHQMLGMNGGQIYAGTMPFVPTTQVENSNSSSQDHINYSSPSAYQNLAGLGMYRDSYPAKQETVTQDVQNNATNFFRFQAAMLNSLRQHQQAAAMSRLPLSMPPFPPHVWNADSAQAAAATPSATESNKGNSGSNDKSSGSHPEHSLHSSSLDHNQQEFNEFRNSSNSDIHMVSQEKSVTGSSSTQSMSGANDQVLPWRDSIVNENKNIREGGTLKRDPPHNNSQLLTGSS